ESPECRRHALLAYFGEARDGKDDCGNCDVCLDPPEMVDGTEDAQKLLSAVLRTGQVFGQAHIINIVRGANTDKIRSTGHDQLPTYGAGKGMDQNTWRSIVRQLVASGFLAIDVTGHGGMSLTAKGQDLVKGDTAFSYRKDVIKQAAKKKTSRARIAPEDMSTDEVALLELLKDKRSALAREREVPAYMIFSDRSLEDMAREAPKDETAFADIHGVGAAKLKEFAETFLEVIATARTIDD
ncbi:RQC domain-containing protein, partial [Pseudomonadota bacterium]